MDERDHGSSKERGSGNIILGDPGTRRLRNVRMGLDHAGFDFPLHGGGRQVTGFAGFAREARAGLPEGDRASGVKRRSAGQSEGCDVRWCSR